jgi:hypothetical protein
VNNQEAATSGECTFCGQQATMQVFPKVNMRTGHPNPDGTIPLVPLPQVWTCLDDYKRVQRHEIIIGWCEICGKHGDAGWPSDCRAPYLPLAG